MLIRPKQTYLGASDNFTIVGVCGGGGMEETKQSYIQPPVEW